MFTRRAREKSILGGTAHTELQDLRLVSPEPWGSQGLSRWGLRKVGVVSGADEGKGSWELGLKPKGRWELFPVGEWGDQICILENPDPPPHTFAAWWLGRR